MELIDSLHGYKKLKKELREKKWKRDNLHGSSEFTWHMKQHIKLLEAVLLQYRRSHNIFDHNDYVVLDGFISIGRFTRYSGKRKNLCLINYGLGDIMALVKHVRHATDMEVSLGKAT